MKRRSNAPSVPDRMAARGRRVLPRWLLLAMPLAAAAATPAARELAEVLQSTPDAVRGAELYAACAGCHGADGGGDPDGLVPALAGHGAVGQGDGAEGVPRLAAQHYEYLLRQMNDAAQGRRPSMPQEHVRLLEELDVQDFVGVADYLSRQIAGP